MIQPPFRFDWGETVRVADSAPPPLVPGTEVAVVGMTHFDKPREVMGKVRPKGSIAYLIEFEDGTSLEVPDECIEPVAPQAPNNRKQCTGEEFAEPSE